jgi:hypothetical protein
MGTTTDRAEMRSRSATCLRRCAGATIDHTRPARIQSPTVRRMAPPTWKAADLVTKPAAISGGVPATRAAMAVAMRGLSGTATFDVRHASREAAKPPKW